MVELGCGRCGYGLAAARASGARLVGVDFSKDALKAARRQARLMHLDARVELHAADMTATGLPSALADSLLCVDAFHFARPPMAAASEAVRLMKPGGRLVVTTWQPLVPGDRILPERLRHLCVERDLATAGFVDITVEPRPDWARAQHALLEAAVELEPAGDPAIVDLIDEGREVLPLTEFMQRVLVTARAPRDCTGSIADPSN